MQPGRQPNRLVQEPVNLFQPQAFVFKNADNHAARFGAEVDGDISVSSCRLSYSANSRRATSIVTRSSHRVTAERSRTASLHSTIELMRVGLFIPCYIDQFYPQVGLATLDLLERHGIAG